jgi:TRAP-type C4-dicarboxylate transport system permease small subunit
MIVRALHGVNRLLGWLEMAALAVLTLTMFLVVLSQVIFRYALNQPSPWTEEAARYLFIWIALLGAAFGVLQGSHFGFDMIVRRMPSAVQRMERWFVPACMSILVFVLIVHGFRMLRIVSFQVTPALQMPMRYVYFALPVSGILMGFHLLCNYLRTGERAESVRLT